MSGPGPGPGGCFFFKKYVFFVVFVVFLFVFCFIVLPIGSWWLHDMLLFLPLKEEHRLGEAAVLAPLKEEHGGSACWHSAHSSPVLAPLKE